MAGGLDKGWGSWNIQPSRENNGIAGEIKKGREKGLKTGGHLPNGFATQASEAGFAHLLQFFMCIQNGQGSASG